MSFCPHCGDEHGMSHGTGDCGCEVDFEVGMGRVDPVDAAEARKRAEERESRFQASPPMKAVIELEGPGIEGLSYAENMLFMAGWPLPREGGRKSGEYIDQTTQAKCRWRIE